jgi:hypothetical protein
MPTLINKRPDSSKFPAMPHNPKTLIASALFLTVLVCTSPSCKSKTPPNEPPENTSGAQSDTSEAKDPAQTARPGNALEELMKLPDAKKMFDLWVFNHIGDFPEEVFDLATPEIFVNKPNRDLFEVTATFSGTIKTDTYRNPVPSVVYDEEKKANKPFIITEKLDSKGTRKQMIQKFQVRYGPMKWGRHPDKVIWNWEKPQTSDKEIEEYKMGGGPYQWRTAEHFKINAEGTASSDPYIVIRGTPDYDAALARFPNLAKKEAEADARRKRQEEERILNEKLIRESNEEARQWEERKKNLSEKALKQ